MPGFPKWSLSLRFPHQNPVYVSPFPHIRYIPRSSHFCYLYQKTILRKHFVGVFTINLGTKFQTRISSALLVTFIKATEIFSFYIQPKYSPMKSFIFFRAILLYTMVKVIINGAGDYLIKIVSVRQTDLAECWKLEGKFTYVQHRHNVHVTVRQNRLRNTILSLVTPIRPPRQRGDLKSLFISVWKRKVSKKRHFVSGPYKNTCTVNISNHQVKQNLSPVCSLEFFCKAL
jgi:hypothetical protein